jgi:hypothetical protein
VRVPRLVWNKRHNVAALTVSFAQRIWNTRDVGDLVLGYNATGRLARVLILDPRRTLPPGATEREAILTVLTALDGGARSEDIAVLRSALERAPVR